jgi:hypothetical protein
MPLGAASQGSVLDDLVQVRNHDYHRQNQRGFDRRHFDRRHFDRRGVDRRQYDRRYIDRRGHVAPPRHVQRPRPQQRSGPDLGSAVVGAIIGGIIVNQLNQRPAQPSHGARGLSQSHVDWCFNRWRSYRLSDNSYQPYNGPRRVCVSPFGP